MTDLGAGVCRSIEMLSQALQQPYAVRAPVNQNLFYQNPMQVAPQAAEGVYAQLFSQHGSQQDPGSSGSFYYQP